MASYIRRRKFLATLGGTAVWPLAARAQRPAMPLVGFLSPASPETYVARLDAFREGLREIGFVEGHSVAIEYRWAHNRYERLPELAAELVGRNVTVIVAAGSTSAALAAKRATQIIPVVFNIGADPVEVGLVASLAHPGGNVTGLSQVYFTLTAKRLEMLHELVVRPLPIALLVNPINPYTEQETRVVQATANALGLHLHVLNATGERDLTAAFRSMVELQAGALLVGADPVFTNLRGRVIALAAHHGVPAIYAYREFTADGGLISYGTNIAAAYRQVGLYAGRILKGEKPADLPVMQPTKFELVINLKTAKALGLDVPPTLLARADEVIE
jgi:putative tryptophan/tyrosine transport system substrate-binding protein